MPETTQSLAQTHSVNTTLYLEYPDPDKPRISIGEIEDVNGNTDTLYMDVVLTEEELRRINQYMALADSRPPLRVYQETAIRAEGFGAILLSEGKLFYIHQIMHEDSDQPRFYARTITMQTAPLANWDAEVRAARYLAKKDAEAAKAKAMDRAIAAAENAFDASPPASELPPAYAPLTSQPDDGGGLRDAPISPTQTPAPAPAAIEGNYLFIGDNQTPAPAPAPAARAMPDRRLHFLPRGGGGAAQCGADIGGLRMCHSIAYMVNAYARGEVVCADCWGVDSYAVGRVVRMADDESEAEFYTQGDGNADTE